MRLNRRGLAGAEDAETFKSGKSLADSARLFGYIGGPLIFLCCVGCMVAAWFVKGRGESDDNYAEMQERQFD